MVKEKSILRVFFSRILEFVVFIFLLWLMNQLTGVIQYDLYHQIVNFFNENVYLIVCIFVIFFFADIFSVIMFPFDLAYPIFNGIGSILVVCFIFKIFPLLNDLIGSTVFPDFKVLEIITYIIVCIIVIIVGYVKVFAKMFKTKVFKAFVEEDVSPKKINLTRRISWEDVGQNFKEFIYDLLTKLRNMLRRKKK